MGVLVTRLDFAARAASNGCAVPQGSAPTLCLQGDTVLSSERSKASAMAPLNLNFHGPSTPRLASLPPSFLIVYPPSSHPSHPLVPLIPSALSCPSGFTPNRRCRSLALPLPHPALRRHAFGPTSHRFLASLSSASVVLPLPRASNTSLAPLTPPAFALHQRIKNGHSV